MDVRFTPESRYLQCAGQCPLWARSGHRVVRPAGHASSSRLPRGEEFGIHFFRSADIGTSLCNITFELLRPAAPVKRGSVIGGEPDRLVEGGDGAIVILFDEVGVAKIFKGRDVSRIEPDRLVEIRYRTVKIALCREQAATVIECMGILGIDPNRLAVIGDGAVSLTFGLVRNQVQSPL